MAEAVVGGAFLSATLQVLFDRLASHEVVNFFRGPKRNDGDRLLQKLKLSLLGMKPVLDDAERKQITDQSLQEWLDELKHIVYQADDLLDEIATEALRLKVESEYQTGPNQVRAPISTSTSLLDAELVPKIEEIVNSLKYFAKQKDVLGLKEVASEKWSHRLPSTSLVDESRVFGRDSDKEEIIKLLVSNEQSVSEIDVIPIVGMGGVGKTTLAQLVYNDGSVVEHFEMKAWVCVSEEFDVIRVTKTILEAVTSSNYDTQDLNLLQVRLKESLRGKKFLIVLDDVWNENPGHWDILKAPFMFGACGSKIITTTRNRGVASIMQTVPVHHLRQVSDEDCWSLFAKFAFYNGDSMAHPKLEKIGRVIVIQRCKGLPLAAKTLAGLLRSTRDVEEWDNILKSELWDLPEDKNDILPVLRLSYYYLPSRLKQCFAFCSLFPKDYEFEKKELVLLWIAQDFVHQPKGNKTLEGVGDEYFHELLSRSFFQQPSGRKSSFVMHDLVHDLAQVVSGQFIVRLDQEEVRDISTKVRHFSYVQDEYDGLRKFQAIKNAKLLRTFLPRKTRWFTHTFNRMMSDDIWATLRCLRVLSLSHYYLMELPTSIGNLIHLRYLDLSQTIIKQLPEIVCTLYNLQILLLSNCSSLTTLPDDIGKLICLRYLDISGTNLTKMPMQMGRLRGLQYLTDFVVGKCSGSGINELKEFHHLRGKLSLSSLQNVICVKDASEANLKKKKYLEELVLKWSNTTEDSQNERVVLENLQSHTNLQHLTIENYGGTRFPNWLGDRSYSKIVSLFLKKCNNCYSLPTLGQLPSLKKLTIRDCPELLFFSSDGLPPTLKKLSMWDCKKLVVPFSAEMERWYTSLETLKLVKCDTLTHLPLDFFPRLWFLTIGSCDNLEALTFSKERGLQNLTSLESVAIENCRSMVSFPQGGLSAPNLRRFGLASCLKLKVLPEKMQTLFPSLEELYLINCPEIESFPDRGLPSKLRLLRISNCKKLVDRRREWGLQRLPSLRHFILRDDEDVGESFPEEGLLPSTITKLSLENLSNLKSLNKRGFQFLCSLKDLEISKCPQLRSLLEEGVQASLKTLYIHDCPYLQALPEKGLPTSLQTLRIDGCPQLQALAEEGLPPSLSMLVINNYLLLKPRC